MSPPTIFERLCCRKKSFKKQENSHFDSDTMGLNSFSWKMLENHFPIIKDVRQKYKIIPDELLRSSIHAQNVYQLSYIAFQTSPFRWGSRKFQPSIRPSGDFSYFRTTKAEDLDAPKFL